LNQPRSGKARHIAPIPAELPSDPFLIRKVGSICGKNPNDYRIIRFRHNRVTRERVEIETVLDGRVFIERTCGDTSFAPTFLSSADGRKDSFVFLFPHLRRMILVQID